MQSGALKADEALPSERDLARELGISRVTVRKAIAGLVEDGLLVQRWGSGTFMAARMHVEQPLSRLSSFTDDMITRGLVPSARFLHRGLGPVSPKEAMALSLSPGETVSRIQRLRLADETPAWRSNMPSTLSRFLPDPQEVESSLYAVLIRRGYAPRRALQRLHAVLLSEAEAALLKLTPGAAALYIERRSFLAGGEAVELHLLLHPLAMPMTSSSSSTSAEKPDA